MPEQPPNENGASYHEDGQRAKASPDPPLPNEKTELLLEEREHGNTEYLTPVHVQWLIALSAGGSKVTGGNFLFDFTFISPTMFRLNRRNFLCAMWSFVFVHFVCI